MNPELEKQLKALIGKISNKEDFYIVRDQLFRVIHLASVKFENGIVVPVLPFVQSICGKYYLQTEIGLCENYTH